MVKKSEKKNEETVPISDEIPYTIKRMFKENGITDEKKIIGLIRGK